jgi:hypothetical protein
MASLFSWGKDDASPSPENPANPAPMPGTPADSARAAAVTAAGVELEASARRRGRPRKDAPTGGGNQPSVSPELAAEIARQMEVVYAPEQWGALLSLPGDAMQTFTGREFWELSKDERKTLGVCGSAAARCMMIQNPKTLAFLMLGSAMLSAYLPRAIKELQIQRAKAEPKNEVKPA